MAHEGDDRILRVWTPVILRTSVMVSAVILAIGLIIIGLYAPDRFVERFHELQAPGVSFPRERLGELFAEATRGQPRPVLMIGLLVLTLLILGVVLGRVG